MIELLLVVAIILVLIALLVPAVTKGKKHADQITCLSRVRAWGVALQGYCADNESRYPNRDAILGSWLGKAGTGTGYALEGLQSDDRPLNTYVGGPYAPLAEVPEARCPRDITTRIYLGTPVSNYNYEGASYFGNIPNSNLNGVWQPACRGLIENKMWVNGYGRNEFKGRKTSDVVDGSRMVAISEMGAYVASWWSAGTWISGGNAYRWHELNAWNMSFADGSARSTIITPQSFTNDLYSFDYAY